ncbi:MAG: FadR family transcriptional regulator [Gemmatimonadaceae bacterium]|nr:FadR family transcriptional regulator [Gemmatimonadaceae bacterium]
MEVVFQSVSRQSLSDEVAQQITHMIQARGFKAKHRLPAISQMARQFKVGSPTLREALKKLETVGVVDIRHGSGVYVGQSPDALLITNPVFGGNPSKKLLVDLIDSRIPVEMRTAALAAQNATPDHLNEMERLLSRAGESLEDGDILNRVNLSFHGQIALASGNVVMHQLLDVLAKLFQQEQRVILDIKGNRSEDHAEHVGIFEAIRKRDSDLATEKMREHLERVREVLTGLDAHHGKTS